MKGVLPAFVHAIPESLELFPDPQIVENHDSNCMAKSKFCKALAFWNFVFIVIPINVRIQGIQVEDVKHFNVLVLVVLVLVVIAVVIVLVAIIVVCVVLDSAAAGGLRWSDRCSSLRRIDPRSNSLRLVSCQVRPNE